MALSLEQSLMLQTICPVCKESWTDMALSLKEGIETDNGYNAMIVTKNCRCCRMRFKEDIDILRGVKPGEKDDL